MPTLACSRSHSSQANHSKQTAPDVEKGHDETTRNEHQEKESAFKSLGLLNRFLAVWIFLAMAIGIILGNFVPSTGPALQKGTFVGVSIPIAVGLLVMMYPILCKIRYESLHHVFRTREVWIQMAFSVFLNWIVCPFLMVCFVIQITPFEFF